MTTTGNRHSHGVPSNEIFFTIGACSLGSVLVATGGHGLLAVLIGENSAALRDDLAQRFASASLVRAETKLASILRRVVNVIEDPACGHDLALDIRGTHFQRRVWAALQTIPAGQTRSYAQIALAIGAPAAARAVAAACGANTLAVLIPCHRVVRGDGALAGYRWGVDRKQALLAREKLMAIAA